MDALIIRFMGYASIKLDDNSGVMSSNFLYMLFVWICMILSVRGELVGFLTMALDINQVGDFSDVCHQVTSFALCGNILYNRVIWQFGEF